ncbi:hypothetical protein KI387_039568, partial [Taxus chinensis]
VSPILERQEIIVEEWNDYESTLDEEVTQPIAEIHPILIENLEDKEVETKELKEEEEKLPSEQDVSFECSDPHCPTCLELAALLKDCSDPSSISLDVAISHEELYPMEEEKSDS